MMKQKKYDLFFCLAAVLCAVLIFSFICRSTGQWLWSDNPYCSYMLQAKAWLEGRLDLGQNYEYLELAVFGGKYYVSFPPFPSVVMLPFAFFGFDKADGSIAFVSSMLGVFYSVRLAQRYIKNRPIALMMALFATVGSNWLFCATNSWVWFIAQNMAFTLTVMSVYYAVEKKPGVSLFLWACAVGCRPFQIIYILPVAYILYNALPQKGVKNKLIANWKSLIAPFVVAVFYMWLNYARFGNITEFGHNYLPEFTRTATGQFNISYLAENFPKLWRLPFSDGHINFYTFDGFCIFIASPIFIAYVVYTIIGIKSNVNRHMLIMILVLVCVHLVSISMHKTMGGAHIGNRYTNDIIPFAYFAILTVMEKKNKAAWLNAIPFAMGLILNVYWNICFYTNNMPWQ